MAQFQVSPSVPKDLRGISSILRMHVVQAERDANDNWTVFTQQGEKVFLGNEDQIRTPYLLEFSTRGYRDDSDPVQLSPRETHKVWSQLQNLHEQRADQENVSRWTMDGEDGAA